MAPAARAALAAARAPSTCTASKVWAPELDENAHQVNDRGSALRCPTRGFGKAQVGLYGHDLADASHWLEMSGEIGAAHGCANAPAITRQGTHGMAADKAGCAKYCRQASLFAPQHAHHLRIQWHLRASNNAMARGCEAAQAHRVAR